MAGGTTMKTIAIVLFVVLLAGCGEIGGECAGECADWSAALASECADLEGCCVCDCARLGQHAYSRDGECACEPWPCEPDAQCWSDDPAAFVEMACMPDPCADGDQC